jgi:hypothetical protein
MRIVKWTPQERVDIPDITAMGFLVLGEFRRMTRGAILGEDANSLIRGFRVEPAGVPDSTIIVKLDDGGVLSFAYGAELIGARTDYGQLIGGDNSDGNTEGNAQQSLDFTGQPAATYTVKIRFTYTDGANDNRAFWNETGNTEFISAIDTRHLPQYEISLAGAGPEWINLADVVWDTVSIDAGDITDLRAWAFEGDSPWQQTTKLGAGGMPDFTRAASRQDTDLNAIYPAMRGLARQIQDIKGADDAGNWNWWNDPYLALDPNGTLTRDQTTSLRSLRTVHYTIGDGVGTQGDFNGYGLGEGLDECLSHIETHQADLRGQIIIQILVNPNTTGASGVDTPFEIGNYVFTNEIVVEIRGGGGVTNDDNDTQWYRTPILCAGTLTTYALDFTGFPRAGCILSDLRFVDTGSDTRVCNFSSVGGKFYIERCTFQTQGSAANLTLRWGPYNGYLRDTQFYGGYCDLRAQRFQDPPTISNCYFGGTPVEVNSNFHRFVNCQFRSGHATVKELVIIESAEDVHFDHCDFRSLGTTALSGNQLDIRATGFDAAENIKVTNCSFVMSQTGNAPHEPGAGANGADGTGWCIAYDGTGHTGTRSIQIAGCIFEYDQTSDAGCISLLEHDAASVANCDFFNMGVSSGVTNPICEVISVRAAGLDLDAKTRIVGNAFYEWQGGQDTEEKRCISIDDVNHVVISGNSFQGHPTQTGNTAIYIIGGDHATITGNSFRENIDGHAVFCSGGTYGLLSGNTFDSCDGAIYVTNSADEWSFTGNNVFGNFLTPTGAVFGIFETQGTHTCITGNSVHNYNGTFAAIWFGASSCVVIGNQCHDGDIDANSNSGTSRGFNYASDVNFTNNYIV